MKKRYDLAVLRLFPNAEWSVQGDDYTKISFEDSSIIPPAIEELENELAKMKQEVEETKAKRQALLDKLGITEDEARLLLGGN